MIRAKATVAPNANIATAANRARARCWTMVAMVCDVKRRRGRGRLLIDRVWPAQAVERRPCAGRRCSGTWTEPTHNSPTNDAFRPRKARQSGWSQGVAAPLGRSRLFQKLGQSLSGRSPTQGFTRPSVELVGNSVELGLCHTSQAAMFRKVLAEEAVGVLVAAPLPRVAGVTEVDGDAGLDCEALVLRHLSALVPSQ